MTINTTDTATMTVWQQVVATQLQAIKANKKATIKATIATINAETGLTVEAPRTKAEYITALETILVRLAVAIADSAIDEEWEELSPCGTMSLDEWEDIQAKKARTMARMAMVERCPINAPMPPRTVEVQPITIVELEPVPTVADITPSATGVAIDSATITLPLERVTMVSSALRSLTYVVTVDPTTGEYTDTNPREVDNYSHVTYGNNGVDAAYSTKYIKSRIGGKGQTATEVLSLTVQSKQLQHHYLDGIHQGTIRALYDSIMNEGVVSFSFEDFIKARISDVDIKQDAALTNGVSFMQFADVLMENCNKTIFGMESFESPKIFGKRGNKTTGEGFQMGTRDKKAKKPMVKVYNKQVELVTKSETFYSRFLQGVPVSKAIRYEISFKNRANMERYNIIDRQEPVSFEKVLERLDNRCLDAMTAIRSEYLGMESMPEATEESEGDYVEEGGALDINKVVCVKTVIDVITELAHKCGNISSNEAKTYVSRVLGLTTEEERKKARKKMPLKKIDEHTTYRMQELRNSDTKSNLDKFPEQLRYAMISFLRETDKQERINAYHCRDAEDCNPSSDAVLQEDTITRTVFQCETATEHTDGKSKESVHFRSGGINVSICTDIS